MWPHPAFVGAFTVPPTSHRLNCSEEKTQIHLCATSLTLTDAECEQLDLALYKFAR